MARKIIIALVLFLLVLQSAIVRTSELFSFPPIYEDQGSLLKQSQPVSVIRTFLSREKTFFSRGERHFSVCRECGGRPACHGGAYPDKIESVISPINQIDREIIN